MIVHPMDMIQETITYHCHICGSPNIVRNGTNKCSNAQYHCRDCNAYRVLKPRALYAQTRKEEILRAYQERCSLRGLERIFHVSPQTISRWIREAIQLFPDLEDTLLPADGAGVLELDELWSFVLKKEQKRWKEQKCWLCLVALALACSVSPHASDSCLVPQRSYVCTSMAPDSRFLRRCHSFSDFWHACQQVLCLPAGVGRGNA